jgi:hypothetical protein
MNANATRVNNMSTPRSEHPDLLQLLNRSGIYFYNSREYFVYNAAAFVKWLEKLTFVPSQVMATHYLKATGSLPGFGKEYNYDLSYAMARYRPAIEQYFHKRKLTLLCEYTDVAVKTLPYARTLIGANNHNHMPLMAEGFCEKLIEALQSKTPMASLAQIALLTASDNFKKMDVSGNRHSSPYPEVCCHDYYEASKAELDSLTAAIQDKINALRHNDDFTCWQVVFKVLSMLTSDKIGTCVLGNRLNLLKHKPCGCATEYKHEPIEILFHKDRLELWRSTPTTPTEDSAALGFLANMELLRLLEERRYADADYPEPANCR